MKKNEQYFSCFSYADRIAGVNVGPSQQWTNPCLLASGVLPSDTGKGDANKVSCFGQRRPIYKWFFFGWLGVQLFRRLSSLPCKKKTQLYLSRPHPVWRVVKGMASLDSDTAGSHNQTCSRGTKASKYFVLVVTDLTTHDWKVEWPHHMMSQTLHLVARGWKWLLVQKLHFSSNNTFFLFSKYLLFLFQSQLLWLFFEVLAKAYLQGKSYLPNQVTANSTANSWHSYAGCHLVSNIRQWLVWCLEVQSFCSK